MREILHEVYRFGWSCMPKACWARLDQAARRLKKLIFLSVTSTPGELAGALTSLADADPLVTDGAISSGMHWPVGNQAVVLKPPLLTCPLTTCVRVPVTGLRVISRRCPPPQHTREGDIESQIMTRLPLRYLSIVRTSQVRQHCLCTSNNIAVSCESQKSVQSFSFTPLSLNALTYHHRTQHWQKRPEMLRFCYNR